MLLNPFQILGAGVGIEIRGDHLQVALVKSRWKGVTVAGKTTICDFRRRPANDWGPEYRAFLKEHGFVDQAAMLALPRAEVIVRLVSLPAVRGGELSAAVRYQVDSLHPYGEEDVYFSFAPLPRSAPGPSATGPGVPAPLAVAVVIASRTVVDGYADLFAEAGVKLKGCTVAAAVFYGATRLLRRRPPEPFLLVDQQDFAFEIYGESEARPFLSAHFDARATPLEKAVSVAGAELRLPEEEPLLLLCGDGSGDSPLPAEKVLGSLLDAPPEFDLKRDATVLATAVSAACPRWGWRTNLLPAARRSSSALWPVAATATAAVCVTLVALLLWLRGPLQDRRYARGLEQEVKRLEAVEREVRGLERQAQRVRARRAQLQSFRRRAEADLLLVAEISRRLPKTAWLNNLEVDETSVQMGGLAESAAPLLGLLDDSGVLTGASFAGSIARNENREIFRIRATRRALGPETVPAPAPGVPTNAPPRPGAVAAAAPGPSGGAHQGSEAAPPPAPGHSNPHESTHPAR